MEAVIIGGGAKPRHVDIEFFSRDDIEFWGFNAIRPKWVKRWSRMFNIHRYDLLKRYAWPTVIECEWAVDHPEVRFFTADRWPDLRMSRAGIFPAEELKAMPRGDYHCNTFDWLVAYAVHLGFDAVHLHGCRFALDLTEQMSARACMEYWCGYAEAKGTRIIPAPDCDLFYAYHVVRSNRLYGYDDCPVWEDRTATAIPGEPPYRYDE